MTLLIDQSFARTLDQLLAHYATPDWQGATLDAWLFEDTASRRAAEARFRAAGITAVALTGRDGGDTPGRADLALVVPSDTTARIQEMHIMLGQMLCGALEIALGLVPDERPSGN